MNKSNRRQGIDYENQANTFNLFIIRMEELERTCEIYQQLLIYPGSSTIRGLLGNAVGILRKIREEAKAQLRRYQSYFGVVIKEGKDTDA